MYCLSGVYQISWKKQVNIPQALQDEAWCWAPPYVIPDNSHDTCEAEILTVSILQLWGQNPRSSNTGRVSELRSLWVEWGPRNASPRK